MSLVHAVLASLVDAVFQLTSSLVPAVAVLSVVVHLMIRPLVERAARVRRTLRDLEPEVAAIKARHAAVPVEQNAALMALYQQRGTSPLGLVVPALLQVPVVAIVWRFLAGLVAVDRRGLLSPRHLAEGSVVRRAIAGRRTVRSLGLDLGRSGWSLLTSGAVAAVPPHVLLAALVGVATATAVRWSGGSSPTLLPLLVGPAVAAVFAFAVPGVLGVHVVTASVLRAADGWWRQRRP